MRTDRRRVHLILAATLAGVVASTVALTLPRDFSVGNFVDDAHYAVLAKSLREHGTYRTLNLPGQPRETKYPPGYPALLALFWSPERADLENLDRMRWVNLVLVGPTAVALTVLGATTLSLNPWSSAALAASGVLAQRTVAMWTVPLSGLFFLFCVTIGLILLKRLPPGWRLVMLSLSVYVRTIAVAFAIAAVFMNWIRRDNGWVRDAAVLVGMMTPWLLWQMANRGAVPGELLGLYGSYGAWYMQSLLADAFTVLVRVPITNARDILLELGTFLVDRRWAPDLARALIGVLVVWRIVLAMRADRVLVVALGLYAVIMIAWPFPPDRFLAGVWPLALLALAASFSKNAWAVAVVVGVVASFALTNGQPTLFHRVRSRLAAEIATAADNYITPNDVVASTNASLYYLRYGTPSVPGQRMRTYRRYRLGYWSTAWGLGDDVWQIVQRYQVTKAIVEVRGVEGRYAVGSLLGQCPSAATTLWESESGAMVLEVHPNEACEPRTASP